MEGKIIIVIFVNRSIRFLFILSVEIFIIRDRKKVVYNRRKVIIVCRVVVWVMVLIFLYFLVQYCIFFICFIREKIRRRKVIKDILKGINVNIKFGIKISLENFEKLFEFKLLVMFFLVLQIQILICLIFKNILKSKRIMDSSSIIKIIFLIFRFRQKKRQLEKMVILKR